MIELELHFSNVNASCQSVAIFRFSFDESHHHSLAVEHSHLTPELIKAFLDSSSPTSEWSFHPEVPVMVKCLTRVAQACRHIISLKTARGDWSAIPIKCSDDLFAAVEKDPNSKKEFCNTIAKLGTTMASTIHDLGGDLNAANRIFQDRAGD